MDDNTSAPIAGSESIVGYTSSVTRIHHDDWILVPALASSLIATKAFSKQTHHYIHTEFGITTISTPSYTISTDDAFHDPSVFIYLIQSPPIIHVNHNTPRSIPNTIISTLPTNQSTSAELMSTTHSPPAPDTTKKEPPFTPTHSDLEKYCRKIDAPFIPPHWIKPKLKITYKNNDGLVHRGVLCHKTPFRWTITVKKSRRRVHSFDLSTTNTTYLHNKKRLFPGHTELLSSPDPSSSVPPAINIPKPSIRTHDILISSLLKDALFTIDQIWQGFGLSYPERNPGNKCQQFCYLHQRLWTNLGSGQYLHCPQIESKYHSCNPPWIIWGYCTPWYTLWVCNGTWKYKIWPISHPQSHKIQGYLSNFRPFDQHPPSTSEILSWNERYP